MYLRVCESMSHVCACLYIYLCLYMCVKACVGISVKIKLFYQGRFGERSEQEKFFRSDPPYLTLKKGRVGWGVKFKKLNKKTNLNHMFICSHIGQPYKQHKNLNIYVLNVKSIYILPAYVHIGPYTLTNICTHTPTQTQTHAHILTGKLYDLT